MPTAIATRASTGPSLRGSQSARSSLLPAVRLRGGQQCMRSRAPFNEETEEENHRKVAAAADDSATS